MRKKDGAMRGALLDCARAIAAEEGAEGISIRNLAARAGIATGTVYNYFASKEDVLLALTEEYWNQALFEMRKSVRDGSFAEQLRDIYAFLRARVDGSAGNLMSSLGGAEAVGRERMHASQSALRTDILLRMRSDPNIRSDIWTDGFTQEQCADFILRNLLISLQAGAEEAGFSLELVRRTLY